MTYIASQTHPDEPIYTVYTDRQILDNTIAENNKIKKDTIPFFDMLPKDVIQYLRKYTGPIDCCVYRDINRYYVYIGNNKEKASNYLKSKAVIPQYYQNNYLIDGKLIFIDGVSHIAIPIPKKNIYNYPKPKHVNTKVISSNKKSTRCKGVTLNGTRCKQHRRNGIEYCWIHMTD